MTRAMLALVLATLFFGRQIASWSSPNNRFLYFWQRSDGLYLVLAVLLTAALLYAVGLLVVRCAGPRVRRGVQWVFTVVFVLLLFTLFLPSFSERPIGAAGSVAVLIIGIVGLGLWYSEAMVTRAILTAALVLAPLPPLLFLQILTWHPWPACSTRPVAGPRQNARPVFVLLFDEWSIAHSRAGGEFIPKLPSVRGFASRSFVFQDARSPGDITYKSIPRLLYQEQGSLTLKRGDLEWVEGGRPVSIHGRTSLFRLARSRGYVTNLTGWYLPYGALVGGDLDNCRVYLQEIKRPGLSRVWDHVWDNLQYLPEPLSLAIWRELHARLFSQHWVEMLASIDRDARNLATSAPSNSLVFIHYPLPHAPFVLDENGAYRGPFTGYQWQGTTEDYLRHVRYVDVVIGRFLQALEAAGKMDSALVVITSDHGWRRDPLPYARSLEDLQHVPLLIKWPGQRTGELIDGRFCLLSLGAVIEQAIGPRVSAEAAAGLLNGLATRGAAGKCRQEANP
jgi:Sulfatase